MGKDVLRFEHVVKQFEGTTAVKDLNLTIGDGELFVLVGASGSGKTTTLKMINRLIEPTDGNIYFNDKRLIDTNLRDLRWNIGYVLQQIALFPNMTVAQNIALIPQMKHWSKEQIRETVDDMLTAVDLEPKQYRDRMPAELSGGEQQRVGICRALATKPPMVLMDEPFSALDPISRTSLQDMVMRLHKKMKTTIVFVTHDMNEAMRLGDRIAVMREGVLQQVATPEEIASNPASNFVSDFFASAAPEVLDTPLIELRRFAERSTEAGEAQEGDPLRAILTPLGEGKSVTVACQQGNFKVNATQVMAFLADVAKD